MVPPLNLLYRKTSSDVDNTDERTVFMTGLSCGVEGISQTSSTENLSGDVRRSWLKALSALFAVSGITSAVTVICVHQ